MTQTRGAPSIRRRFAVIAFVVIVVVLGLVGWALDRAFAANVIHSIRERLESTVYLVLASAPYEAAQPEFGVDLPDGRLPQPDSGWYAGVDGAGRDWRSPSALMRGSVAVPEVGVRAARFRRPGSQDGVFVLAMGILWETASGETLPLTVWAATERGAFVGPLTEFRAGLWRWLGAVGLVVAGVLAVGGWMGMRPLDRVVREVQAIEQGQRQRLSLDVPAELRPLAENLNTLLAAEQAGQKRYRMALGNLAHSLKTQLSVLRSALGGRASSGGADLEQARQAVDEMDGVIRYQLERAASATRRGLAEPIAVQPELARLARSLRQAFVGQAVEIELEVAPDCKFYGERRDLLEIAGNLMENACKYGGGRVWVGARQVHPESRRPGLELAVEDNGMGLAAADFQRLLQRGVRGDSRREGQGLGLAIAAEIADAYNADIDCAPGASGGARIRVAFPAA